MTGCSALGCKSRTEHGKRMFRFPSGTRNADRRARWLRVVRRKNFVPTPSSRLCEDHFEDSEFECNRADNRRLLKVNAVPTIWKEQEASPRRMSTKVRASDAVVHPSSSPNTGHAPQQGGSTASGDVPQDQCMHDQYEQAAQQAGATASGDALQDQHMHDQPEQAAQQAGATASGDALQDQHMHDQPENADEECAAVDSTSLSVLSSLDEDLESVALALVDMRSSTPTPYALCNSEDTGLSTTVRENESRATVKRVGQMRTTVTPQELIDDLRRRLNLAYKKIRKLEKKLEAMENDPRGHLSKDQLVCIQNTDMRGNRWSEDTIKKALKIRLCCGRGGYTYLRESKSLPLPCERILLKRIEDIKFSAGVLEELLPALECKVKSMAPSERHAVLLVDEMQLTPGLDYDSSTKTVIGHATVPPSGRASGGDATHATHGLVFMLAGLSSRWKQTVGYHFTGDSVLPATLKEVAFDIITKSEAIGLTVDAVISDMGPSNKGLWRMCGISASRSGEPTVSCLHPCAGDSSRQLYFIADAPHILKNVRGHLIREQCFYLPKDIVALHKLPTDEVSVSYIKVLVEEDAKHDLKLAPHLKPKHLDGTHYDKMNVSCAVAVLNHAVAAGIKYLVEARKLPEKALTTAWFLEQVHRWFTLITSRSFSVAMSKAKENKHDEAVTFLKGFMKLFQNLNIRKAGQADAFKPVQAGVLITTASAIHLQKKLLEEYKFRFVLLSRLSQDALENLFSTVRRKHPVPRPLEFKSTLRIITLAQFFNPSRHGSYEHDDSVDLLEYIASRPPVQSATEDEIPPDSTEAEDIDDAEQESLCYLAGYSARAVMRKHSLCDNCISFLKDDPGVDHGTLLSLKSYRSTGDNPLVTPSRSVVELLTHGEKVFRNCEDRITKLPMSTLRDTVLSANLAAGFPQCHDLATKLLNHFLLMRLRFHLRKVNAAIQKKQSLKCGSRSIAMRALVDKVK